MGAAPAKRLMGAHGRPSMKLRVPLAVVAVAGLVSAVFLRNWLLVATFLIQVVTGAFWQWAPPLHLNEAGFKRELRPRVPWRRVTQVRETSRWRPSVQVVLDDGREIVLPGVGAEQADEVRRLAGLDEVETVSRPEHLSGGT